MLDESDTSMQEEEEEVEDLSPPKVLGDILESLAGAIFIDSGFCLESVWRVFRPHFERKIGNFPCLCMHKVEQIDQSCLSQCSVLSPECSVC